MKNFVLRLIMVMAGMLVGHSAFAAPAVCSWGYQDSTCLTPLRGSGPAAPTCSGQGVITVTPAVWQGSHWSQPTCQTLAPPTCPAGETQTSAPVWNGSSWSAPGCFLPAQTPPPVVTPSQQESSCATTGFFPGMLGEYSPVTIPASDDSFSPAGTMSGAATYSNVYSPLLAAANVMAPNVGGCWGSNVITNGTMPGSGDGSVYNVFVAQVPLYNTQTGQSGIGAASICYVPAGTATVAYQMNIGLQKIGGSCH
jgi:hypothetical protein